MIRKFIPLFALCALAAGAAGSARAQDARQMMTSACAPGYHIYSDGSCQSDNMVVDNRCQPGFMVQVFPNGNDYICKPEHYQD